MEDNRIQNQIAIYMTNKKLCEFTDKLKPAPIEYYAHMHAQGEEQADGIRAYSCIGVVLQDYSNGTGDKTVRVTANLSPGFFPFVLSRMQNNLDRFDFTEDKIFGEPGRAWAEYSDKALGQACVGWKRWKAQKLSLVRHRGKWTRCQRENRNRRHPYQVGHLQKAALCVCQHQRSGLLQSCLPHDTIH